MRRRFSRLRAFLFITKQDLSTRLSRSQERERGTALQTPTQWFLLQLTGVLWCFPTRKHIAVGESDNIES